MVLFLWCHNRKVKTIATINYSFIELFYGLLSTCDTLESQFFFMSMYVLLPSRRPYICQWPRGIL